MWLVTPEALPAQEPLKCVGARASQSSLLETGGWASWQAGQAQR